MRIEQIELALRRRNPWEALDLGLVMLRRWRAPVYRAWLATYVPFALLVLGALWQWPGVASLIVWWAKPLFDRVLLKVYAEASFGAPPSVRQVWKALPGLLWRSGLIAGLTWRRLSSTRSFNLPIVQLEGQRGKAARARRKVLARRTGYYASWLTFVCIHVVAFFEIGMLLIAGWLIPSTENSWESMFELFVSHGPSLLAFIVNIAYVIAESIVEPYFVAAGFALYLNRRSDIEGWDIEVAFRRMAERLPPGAPGAASGSTRNLARTAVLAFLLLGAGTALLDSAPVRAEETSPTTTATETTAVTKASSAPRRPSGEAGKVAKAVLADPVFGQNVPTTEWRLRNRDEQKKDEPLPSWAETLTRIVAWFAEAARWLIYVGVAIGVAALIVVLYRYRHLIQGRLPQRAAPPETLFGLDVRPASLPDDVAAAALRELEAGHAVAALSLLYRGALVALMHRRHVEFRTGDTEDACLRRARAVVERSVGDYFAALLDAWKRVAYAGKPLAAAEGQRLCADWRRHFDAPTARPATNASGVAP